MKPSQTILKNSAAILLLLLFSISTIPKIFFHDLLANHRDEVVCKHVPSTAPCVHQQGFHCGFDDLVVSTPYLVLFNQNNWQCPVVNTLLQATVDHLFLQQHSIHEEDRGPPEVRS